MPKPLSFLSDFQEDPSGIMGTGMTLLTDAVAAGQAGEEHKSAAKGQAIGGTAGAVLGSFVPGGTMIGQQLGSAIGKMIGGAKDNNRMMNKSADANRRLMYSQGNSYNANPFGYMEEGGAVPYADGTGAQELQALPSAEEIPQQQPTRINIERGEIMVSADGKILQEFTNPNSYFPHNKEKRWMEPVGNFVTLPEGAVIIPKKHAQTYKEGDKITQRSLLMNIIKDQANDPARNIMMADGGVTGDPTKPKGPDDPTVKSMRTESDARDFRDPYYEASATLSYYKDQLNQRLRDKNPENYDKYFSGFKGAMTAEGVKNPMQARREYVQKADYNDYLSPEEVKGTLGEHYNNYLNSIKAVNAYNVAQGQEPLYGNIEGEGPLENLNYGRRFASMQVTPSVTNSIEGTGRSYTRNYSYDPEKGISYTESGDMSAQPSYLRPKQPSGQAPVNVAKMADGGITGKLPKGPTDDELNRFTLAGLGEDLPVPSAIIDPVTDAMRKGIIADPRAGMNGEAAAYAPTTMNSAGVDNSTAAGATGRQLDWGAVGKRALAFLPGALQAAQANQGDPHLKPVYNHGFNKAKASIEQLPTDFNIQDQIADVDQQLAAGLEAISSANTPSARAEAQNMVATAAKAKGGIRANASRVKAEAVTNKLAKLAGLDVQQGEDLQREGIRYQTEQRMNDASRRNIQNNAASEAYQNFSLIENENQQIEMLNSMSKFVDIDPVAMNKIKEDPGARNYVTNYVMEKVNAGVDIGQATQEAVANVEAGKHKGKTITVDKTQRKTTGTGFPKENTTSRTVIRK